MAVDILDSTPVTAADKRRASAHRLKGPHGTVDAARQHLTGLREEKTRAWIFRPMHDDVERYHVEQ